MKKIWLPVLFILLAASCSKDNTVHPASGVNMKFHEDLYYLPFMRVDAHWDYQKAKATITAYGYAHEVFYLDLEQVTDTGNISRPTIRNICFTDGLSFNPDTLTDGYIHIDQVSNGNISGRFHTGLTSYTNNTPYRTIEGGFTITTQ